MKIDFSTVLTQFSGEPITSEGNAPFTLGMCVVNALLQPQQQQQNPMEKIRRARIAERAYDAGETDVSPEDLVTIREAVGSLYPPLIVYRAYALLGEPGQPVPLKTVG
jgi:hypothetical protein